MAMHAALKDRTLKKILPFSIDEASISVWLNSLQTHDKVGTLQVLSHTLESLKKATISLQTRANFIEQISALVFKLTDELEKTYLNKSFPFSSNEHLKIKLSAECTLRIADNYALICEDMNFKEKSHFSFQQKASILVNAIQSLSKVLLFKGILYEKPNEGFWTLCYLFYLIAKQNRALTIVPYGKKTNFIKVFKFLFVFELSHIQQFSTEEIHIIFSLLIKMAKHVELLPLMPEKRMDNTPCINLRSDTPPSASHLSISKTSPHLFYVSSLNLINQLFKLLDSKKNISYSNKIIVLRLIKTLSKNHSRKETREPVNKEFFAEIGYDSYSQSLMYEEAVSTRSRIISSEFNNLSLDTQLENQYKQSLSKGFNKRGSHLSLVLRADDRSIEHIDSTDIWSSKKKPFEKSTEINATLLDQSNSGFNIGIKGDQLKTKVGEIINLQIPPSSIVAVVRRIIPSNEYNMIIGVEVLGHDAELLHVVDVINGSTKPALILKDKKGAKAIVIKADEYQGDKYIFANRLEKNIRYKVEKILKSSTATIKHLKVSLA